jgi:hypothetical protein
VATTTCASRAAFACGRIGTPPYTVATESCTADASDASTSVTRMVLDTFGATIKEIKTDV